MKCNRGISTQKVEYNGTSTSDLFNDTIDRIAKFNIRNESRKSFGFTQEKQLETIYNKPNICKWLFNSTNLAFSK